MQERTCSYTKIICIHRLQIWRRMHESEAFRWQPLLRADSLTLYKYSFSYTSASCLHFRSSYFFEDISRKVLFVRRYGLSIIFQYFWGEFKVGQLKTVSFKLLLLFKCIVQECYGGHPVAILRSATTIACNRLIYCARTLYKTPSERYNRHFGWSFIDDSRPSYVFLPCNVIVRNLRVSHESAFIEHTNLDLQILWLNSGENCLEIVNYVQICLSSEIDQGSV